MSVNFAFIDSGTGGIPYMLELKKKSPDSSCVYLGDTAHFPYGEKSLEQITECAAESIRKIISNWNPEVLIIACNTISVTALDKLREIFPDLPIIGTVPAIKLAATKTRNKKIGLLATNATVHNPYSVKLIQDFASDCEVFSRGDPELISFIEHDLFDASEDEKDAAVKDAVDFFAANNCDTIILGCTHFCHIDSVLKRVCGNSVTIVDSRDGVCNQALKVLSQHEYKSIKSEIPDMSFFVTGDLSLDDEKEYESLCSYFNIPWGGKLD